jgi:RNA polymerase sigma-70 factor (ECF subfamily)
MEDALLTRLSLLLRLRDPHDGPAWQRFIDLYGPVVYRFLCRRGVQDADAADLTQEVFQSVARAAGRLDYDPARGTFRGWLFAITRNKLADFLERRGRQPVGSGDSAALRRLEQEPDPDAAEQTCWDAEYQRQLFRWAAEQVRGGFAEPTWQAFWRTAVEGRPGAEVARELGMSVGAVYVAKSRVLARLVQKVQQARAAEPAPPEHP